MQEPFKRRTYYQKNSAQTTFIGRFVAISLLGGLFAVWAFNFLAYRKIDTVLYTMRLPKISASGLLWREMVAVNVFVILFTLLVFAVTAKGLYRKLNDPLRKLLHDLRRMRKGNLCQTIALREGEGFQDFAQELHTLGEELNLRFREIRHASALVGQKIELLAHTPEPEAARQELASALTELEKTTGFFKV